MSDILRDMTLDERIDATMHPRPITGPEIGLWFLDALDHDDPKPSKGQCEAIAQEIRKFFPGGIYEQNPVDVARALTRERVMDAACALTIALEAHAAYFDKTSWESENKIWPFQKTIDFLPEIGGFPMAVGRVVTRRGDPLDATPTRTILNGERRRPLDWRPFARAIAASIETALRDAGYKGPCGLKTDTNVTVIVLTHAVNRTFGLGRTPAGIVTGLKERHRRKAISV